MKFLVQIGKKWKEDFRERKMVRVFVMLFLAGLVCLWDDSLYYSSHMPDIVFTCTKYDLQQEVCEITFIDKQGACYYSDDPYVCKGLEGKVNKINAYKAGEIQDKIKLCGSCNKKEVIKRYRKLYRIFKKRDIRDTITIPYGGLTSMQSLPRWDWEYLYFDASGELQCVTFHSNYPGYEEGSNNKQVNQIYKWCKDIMGAVKRY